MPVLHCTQGRCHTLIRNLSPRPTRGWQQGRWAVSVGCLTLGSFPPMGGGGVGGSLLLHAAPCRPSAHPDLSPHGQGWGGDRHLALVSATVSSVCVHTRAHVHVCVCVRARFGWGLCTSPSASRLSRHKANSPLSFRTPPPPQVLVESHGSGSGPRTDKMSCTRVCGRAPSACVRGGRAAVPAPRPRSRGTARARHGFSSVRVRGAARQLSAPKLHSAPLRSAWCPQRGRTAPPAGVWRFAVVTPAPVQ